MTKFDYYKAPSDKVFEDIKETAIKIWEGYSDEFGYQTEKTSQIKPLKNVGDNAAFMVAMFDHPNTQKLRDMVMHVETEQWLDALLEEHDKAVDSLPDALKKMLGVE